MMGKTNVGLNSFRYMQYATALTATLPAASVSMYFVWTSPSLPKIKAGNSPLPADITDTEITMIVASLILGCIPGILLTGWSLSKLGRKTTLLIGSIPLLIPWFILAFANSAILVAVGRFIAGIGIPISIVPVMVYTCEIADKDIRGSLALTMKVLALSGELYVLMAGPHLSYKILTLTCGFVPLAFFLGLFYMPESPYYLIKIGKDELAEATVTKLMAKNTDVSIIKNHLDEIRKTVKRETVSRGSFREFLTHQSHRKSLIIGLGLLGLLQLSGASALSAYMQTIFALSASAIAPEISSMIIGLLELCAVILSATIVDKVGRKPLLIISALGCACSLFAEGVYFWLHDALEVDVSSIFWLPTAAFGFNNVMRSLGIGTVPYIVIGEIFSTNVEAHASIVCGLFSVSMAFIVSASFSPITKMYGVYSMFWSYTAICILGALFVLFVQPETKGKTFAEIRQKLSGTTETTNVNQH